MKKVFIAFACLFVSAVSFAQVTEPQKVIKLGSDAHFIEELNLDHGKEYGFLAKDLQELFPTLVKEKRISERFGKNAYRTKVIKVIDEKALIPALVSSIKKQNVEIQDLKNKLVTIEKSM
ncbi:hypothetical protein [Niabella ginsengisoli]|uniref:Peptidase S74 domain-containing protein n=1 Tax=Niabella ginsengisoli TaxID=522298 RepID=A0ABS9SG14_9BACT|nr:hypothetical protein [Niabella ginsengisoli]MCH5597308.1 hypothetical protein [Niabella ginsengisoli]